MRELGRHPVTPFVAAAASILLLLAAGETSFALAAAPTLLLLVQLLSGRFPGERLLARLARRVRGTRMLAAQWRQRRPESVRTRPPSGGLLIAAGLSGRAPPLA